MTSAWSRPAPFSARIISANCWNVSALSGQANGVSGNFTMEEFAASVNEFLAFRRYDILQGSGRISRNAADAKAIAEYEEFNKTQRIESDFDKEVKKMNGTKKD